MIMENFLLQPTGTEYARPALSIGLRGCLGILKSYMHNFMNFEGDTIEECNIAMIADL